MSYNQMKTLLVIVLAPGTSAYLSPCDSIFTIFPSPCSTTLPKVLSCKEYIFFQTDKFLGSNLLSRFVVDWHWSDRGDVDLLTEKNICAFRKTYQIRIEMIRLSECLHLIKDFGMGFIKFSTVSLLRPNQTGTSFMQKSFSTFVTSIFAYLWSQNASTAFWRCIPSVHTLHTTLCKLKVSESLIWVLSSSTLTFLRIHSYTDVFHFL